MAIMYICDQKKYCNASILCGTECKHTADRSHALYKKHKFFVKREDNNSWEKEQEEENDDGGTVE